MSLTIQVKICTKCKEELPATLEYFHKYRNGLRSRCKSCSKEYRKQNKERIKEYQREYYAHNKDRLKEYGKKRHKENYKRNRVSILERNKKWNKENKEYRREYIKRQRETNPQFHLHSCFGNIIWFALKEKGTSKKGYSWETIVNYTIQDLMEHLEKQFTEGMNWDNYGKWHVDHIKPQSSFNFTSYEDNEFQECWNLENLQPLWSQDNLKKSNKINI